MNISYGDIDDHASHEFFAALASHYKQPEDRIAVQTADPFGASDAMPFEQSWSASSPYPNYFKQAQSNLQDCWCCPECALGEFRRWLRDEYIGQGRFAKYITEKVRKQELPASFAQLAIAAYEGSDS